MADHEPTRKELQDQLEAERAERTKTEERLARLEAAIEANKETPEQKARREGALLQALQELAELRGNQVAQPGSLPSGKAPKLQAYKGLARARVDCAYGGYRKGPVPLYDKSGKEIGQEPGEIFEIDVASLWTDDPYEPVRTVSNEDGTVRYVIRNDVPVVDYRWRQNTMPALVA